MKKLMIAVVAVVALASVADEVAPTDWQVYSFTKTAKVFDAKSGKTATQKVSGLAVYDKDNAQQLFAFTWGTKRDTVFTAGGKIGRKAYTGAVADVKFFTDLQQYGDKFAYGFASAADAGYGTGNSKSVKGNFVGDKTFGTWQLKLDRSATQNFAKGKYADINGLLEAKNVEVTQW